MQPSPARGDESETASDAREGAETLSALKQLRLGVARQYYAMTGVLGLKRVQDYLQARRSAPRVLGYGHPCSVLDNSSYLQ